METEHGIWEEELAGYALGILSPEEAAAAAAHLAGCPSCREALARYREAAAAMAYAVPAQRPPARLKARLMAQVRPAARPTGWRWLGIGAALLAAVWLLILWILPTVSVPGAGPRVVVLRGTEAAPAAEGYLILEDGQGLLVIRGLPPPPEGHAYQVWFGDDTSRRMSGGLFRTTERRYGLYRITVPADLWAYRRVGVTLEPEGGSPQPTGPRMLHGLLR